MLLVRMVILMVIVFYSYLLGLIDSRDMQNDTQKQKDFYYVLIFVILVSGLMLWL